MRTLTALLCLVLLLPTASPAAPSEGDPENIELWFLSDITIAPDGTVSRQAWRNFNEMPESILQALERRISTWRFAPVELDGTAVEAETSLLLHTLAMERPDGSFGLEIANAIVGPSLQEGRRPDVDFPEPWRQGYGSGALVFEITANPSAVPVIRFGEYIADTTRPAFKAGFNLQAEGLVAHWTIRHERVAGVPVPATFRHVVYHCRSPRWCAAETGHWGLPRMPPGQPVPSGSVTRLLTDVTTIAAPDDPGIETARVVTFPGRGR